MYIINARIHTMIKKNDNFLVINPGFIRIKNKKIIEIGHMSNLNINNNNNYKIINAQNQEVYPGFIDSHTHLGLYNNGENYDFNDANEINFKICPHLRVLDGINFFDISFTEALKSGITTVIISPGSASIIGGQLAAIKTFGRSLQEIVINSNIGIKFSLGENPRKNSNSFVTRMGIIAKIREILYKSKNYIKNNNTQNFSLKYESFIPLFENKIPAYFHVHNTTDILAAINLSHEFNIKLNLIHATEINKLHIFSKNNNNFLSNLNIIIGPIITDRSKYELKNFDINHVKLLKNLKINFGISTDHPELPSQYLTLGAHVLNSLGISSDDLIAAITINNAKICGIDKFVGSLEINKHADILIFDKNPVRQFIYPKVVIINGEVIK
ncbi:MAG: amidohydrolase [Candidatus Improbicoccus devescovinae]|nr:MAG: amidohydrolase [Candidatus Improbicoccus devescovinae]